MLENKPAGKEEASQPLNRPTFREAFWFWLLLGFVSFGGPTGQIAIMHRELVEKRRWIGEARFLNGLNFCMLLPGPEAQQLATYIGWTMHRTLGGLAAGILFVLPSAVLLWLLSYIYVTYGSVAWIAAVFDGLKPAVVAIVVDATLRIGKRALRTRMLWTLSAAAFVAIFFFKVPFPVIIFGAGLLGFLSQYTPWRTQVLVQSHGTSIDSGEIVMSDPRDSKHGGLRRALRLLAVCLFLWWLPVGLAALWLGRDHVLYREGVFFSKAAMVTFGGAYAVLPYVAQQAVEKLEWLSSAQMMDGLALAETTPGPLIMVLQFVGFVGAWQHPGELHPLVAATLGAAMTTWVTFVPCFLWILVGAPYVEWIRTKKSLGAALTAVTAAVVGVVLNLAIWFAGGVLVCEGQLQWTALLIVVAAFVALRRFKVGIVWVVVGAGIVGLMLRYAGL